MSAAFPAETVSTAVEAEATEVEAVSTETVPNPLRTLISCVGTNEPRAEVPPLNSVPGYNMVCGASLVTTVLAPSGSKIVLPVLESVTLEPPLYSLALGMGL